MEKVSEQKKIEDTKKTLEQLAVVLDNMSNKVLEQDLLSSSFTEIGEIGLFYIKEGSNDVRKAVDYSK